MALDLCLEGAGWLVMMMDTNASDVARFFRRPAPVSPTVVIPPAEPTAAIDERRDRHRAAAASLPIREAQAIFLVDVCGYDYDRAAAALNTDRDDIAVRVGVGRRAIRAASERSSRAPLHEV